MQTKEERLLNICQLVIDASDKVPILPIDITPEIYNIFDAIHVMKFVIRQIKKEIQDEKKVLK